MNKRGIFLSIDLLIAIVVLVIGVVLVFTAFIDRPSYVQARSLSVSYMDFLITNRVDQVAIPVVLNYSQAGVFDNPQDNLLIAMGRLYYQNATGELPGREMIYNLTQNITRDAQLLPQPFEMAFFINQTLLYNTSAPENIPAERTIIPTHRVILGTTAASELWGPYTAEVWIW